MRTNGTLSFEQIQSAETVNEHGELIQSDSSWSEELPCSIKTNSDTRRGVYEDGEFRQASFTVLLELDDTAFSAVSRVRLHRHGELLGEFRVLSLEPLTTMGRLQIIV